MEIIKSEKVEYILDIHQFYCDICKEYIGESEEDDEGYYEDLGGYSLKFWIRDGWYKVDRCLCDKCRAKFTKDIIDTLVLKGFVKE